MRHITKSALFVVAVTVLTFSLALAEGKFKNVDTAKDRQDNSFGTEPGEERGSTVFGKDERGDSTIRSKAAPKADPVDWYDKVIITVNPTTRWPTDQSKTTTTTGYNNATDTQTTTTTTQQSQ